MKNKLAISFSATAPLSFWSSVVLLFLMLSSASCSPQVVQPEKPVLDSQMRKVYLQYYGDYYAEEGLAQCVWAIDAYSDGLLLNKQNVIEGTGTNLYFSDIFAPSPLPTVSGDDDVDMNLVASASLLLPDGSYMASDTGEPFTFLPGTTYETQISGAYLLRIEEGQLMDYDLLVSGVLTLSYEGDTALLHVEGTTARKQTYIADFKGIFTLQDKSNTTKYARSIRLY